QTYCKRIGRLLLWNRPHVVAGDQQSDGKEQKGYKKVHLLLFYFVLFAEDGRREIDAIGLQPFENQRLNAVAAEPAENLLSRADTSALEFKNVLHLHLLVFDAGHLG